jgi:Effector protein
MRQYGEVKNIWVAESLVSYYPNGQGGQNETTMTVEGYETEMIILLSKIRWTWVGWALLKDIWRTSGKTMLIVPWHETHYLDPKDGKIKINYNAYAETAAYSPGYNVTKQGAVNFQKITESPDYTKAHDSIVAYNPDMWTPPQLKAANIPQGPGVTKDEILLHEMVHGLREMTGTFNRTTVNDHPNYDDSEEFLAVVVTNVYRSELKLSGLRNDHHGFQPLTPPELADPEKFVNAPAVGTDSNKSRLLALKKTRPDFVADLKRSPAAFNPFKFI